MTAVDLAPQRFPSTKARQAAFASELSLFYAVCRCVIACKRKQAGSEAGCCGAKGFDPVHALS